MIDNTTNIIEILVKLDLSDLTNADLDNDYLAFYDDIMKYKLIEKIRQALANANVNNKQESVIKKRKIFLKKNSSKIKNFTISPSNDLNEYIYNYISFEYFEDAFKNIDFIRKEERRKISENPENIKVKK